MEQLTLISRILQVLSQITTEDALFEDARLLESAPRRPIEDEAPEEGNQLSVLAQNRLAGLHSFGRLDGRHHRRVDQVVRGHAAKNKSINLRAKRLALPRR